MRILRTICFLAAIAFCGGVAVAQNTPTPNAITDAPSKKEKFELGLEMLKGYRADLQDRFEKSSALLILVIGWLITSDTARKSLANKASLYWSGLTILSALIVMYCLTIYHFIQRFREIQETVQSLAYVDPTYFARYQMPDTVFLLPVHFSYMLPVIFLYLAILILLIQIKRGLI